MFQVKERQIGSVEPIEWLPAKASETYQIGEALVMTDSVTKCGATARPTHICAGAAGEKGVPAIPVLATTRFEVPYTAKPAVGKAVTLHTDGMQVTATETSGVFTVTSVDEAAGTARGYFR